MTLVDQRDGGRLKVRSGWPAPDQELRERMDLIERYARADAQQHCLDCGGDGILEEGDEWTLCDGPSCALVTRHAREAAR